jgi:predicted alpha/beta hydrolase family esterase
MKNAIILHGTGCNPNSFWQPYLKNELEKRDYSVWVPSLPDTDTPDLQKWLPEALKGDYSSETIIIGSAGCPLILSVLENIKTPIKQAILVAGYARPKGEHKEPEKILQDTYNWDIIKNNVKNIIFINSDNDPWGCNDVEGRDMLDHLGGTLIIKKGEGHMGSNKFNQPYLEFPLLTKLTEL